MCWWLRLLLGRGRIRENLWSINSFDPVFLHSAEKPEWGSASVWGCDYLIYLIRKKALQVCSGTCGQNGNQLGIAMEGEAQTSIRLTPSKNFMLLLVTWVRSPTNRLLADLVKPYISHNTCCFSYSSYYQNKREEVTGQEVEGEITLSLFSFSILRAGP